MNKNKLIIILVGFLDVLSIGMIAPTLPDLAKILNVSEHLVSYGITVYAFCAFLATPILGQISDIYGRKLPLIYCVVGSLLSSFVISISGSYALFIVARIINGITGGNISILQAIISDISTNKKELASNMGILGGLFGAAFIIGPLFGSFGLHFGVKVPYFFMAGLSLIEIFVIMIFFEETHKNREFKSISYHPLKNIYHFLQKPVVNLLIICFLLILVSGSVSQAILPLYLHKIYGVQGSQTGYFMSIFGVLIIVNQLLIRHVWLKIFSFDKLMYIISFGLLIVYTSITFSPSLIYFLIFFLLISPFQSLVGPVYQAEIIEKTPHNIRGKTMGVMASIQSISMFIGPLIGGMLLEHSLPLFSVSIFIIIGSLFFVHKILSHPQKTE